MKIAISLAVAVCICAAAVVARPQAPAAEYGPPKAEYGPPKEGDAGAGGYGDGKPAGGYGDGKPGGGDGGGDGGDPLAEDANYQFEYEVKDEASKNDFGHMESRMGDVAMGSYHVLLPDGRMQKVDYVADKDGYKPTITYEGEVIGYGPDVGGGNTGGGGKGGDGGAAPGAGGGYRYRRR